MRLHRHRLRRLLCCAAAAALLPLVAGAETVRFSNIRFDDGDQWTVVKQSPQMVLHPKDPAIADLVTLTIEPAVPFEGTLDAALTAAWAAKTAGHRLVGEATKTEEREVPGGGRELEISTQTQPDGGLTVAVVGSGSFVTRLTYTADGMLAWVMSMASTNFLFSSIEIVQDKPPPSSTSGGPGAAGGSASAATFDWDGPDHVDFGIYDHGCLSYGQEFRALVANGDKLIGSVKPLAVTWQQALATVHGRLAKPGAQQAYDAIRKIASAKQAERFSAGAAASLMQADPNAALAQLLAGAEQAPDDPDLLFNFASMLSTAGLANESLAVLARLKALDRKPILASGVDATAAIAYLTGYAQMLRGELAPAKSQFSAAIGRDRFINEAGQALALIQAHEGNGQQGKETYLASLWRFKPKQLVFCGAQGTKADEQARPPIDEVFDTSMGKPGELVHFWHPARTDDLRRWDKDIGDLLTERGAIMQKAAARMQALAPKVNLSQSRTPDDAYNEKMTLLLEGLDEQEPYVVKLMKAEEAVRTKTEASVGQAGEVYGRENMKFAMSPTRNICPLQRAAATRGIQAVGGPAKELELAMRRTARDWYKMATGLNAKIGDKDWHEYNQASLTVQLETLNVLLLESMNASYGHFGADTDCQEDIPDQPLTGQAVAGGTPCDTILGNMKFKHSFEIPDVPNGPKFSFEVGCDKMKADIQYDLLKAKGGGFGTGLGGIAQVEIGRKGDYTVFAGAKADVSGPLASGSIRSGFYAKGDSSGLKELGGRFEMGSKLGPKGMQRESKERMDFNILPTPPAGERGPALRAFRPPP